ncbi:MAG: hypothetical protein IPQ03_12165 [Bacteroidetes bacterium]|nr:hypothetical protein [Bacteroidota bacterium]
MNKGSQLFSWVGVVVQDYKVRTFFTVDTQCFVVGTPLLSAHNALLSAHNALCA